MKKRKAVWIVTHFEYLGPPYWLDEVVEYVATSRAGALRRIRELRVDPGTWWGIQPFRIEDHEFWSPQVLYSREGREIRRGYSLKRALKLSRKVRVRKAALLRASRRAKKKGGTKPAPSRPS